MATEILFNFYEVLVENVFGSIGLAIMGVAFIILIIMLVCRSSLMFVIMWLSFYLVVMGTLYLGGLGLVFAFIISATYFTTAVIRYFMREQI